MVLAATFRGEADQFRKAGFEDGDTIELTIRKAPEKGEKGKKESDLQAMIQELEKGLRVPGTNIGRSLIDTKLLEGLTDFTDEELQAGHVLGWRVAVSEMADVGQTYYHRTLTGALELALEDRKNGSKKGKEG